MWLLVFRQHATTAEDVIFTLWLSVSHWLVLFHSTKFVQIQRITCKYCLCHALMDRCHYYQFITTFGSKVHCVYCSGGHFNPAVSLSVYLCGGMGLPLLLPYILTQMCGGMIGAGLTKVGKNLKNMEAQFCQEKKKKHEKLVIIKFKKLMVIQNLHSR